MELSQEFVALNYPYHVTQGRNKQQDIFLCNKDYMYYLKLQENYIKTKTPLGYSYYKK